MNFINNFFSFFMSGIFLLFIPLQADTGTSFSNQLRVQIDFAGFLGSDDGSKTYQEIYISFPNYQLQYEKKGDKYFTGYEIEVIIKDSIKKQITDKTWQGISQIDSLNQAEELTMLEIAGFLLSPGKYSLSIKITDLQSGRDNATDIKMNVANFRDKKYQISEIEFARSIKRSQKKSKFVKNNIEILPNPTRVFGIESPFFYFYAEIYFAKAEQRFPLKYTKRYKIIDSRGDTVKTYQKKSTAKSSSTIWAEKINTINLISGKYKLKLQLIDKFSNLLTERNSTFWIHNPYKTITDKQYRNEDIDEFRAQIFSLVNQDEILFFDQLNLQAKINFINTFWKERTPEFRTEHLRRFYFAQERFRSPTLPGWKSDRGRIYIMYGPPDEIDREPASQDTRAYEVWIYERLEKQGQVEFVFSDLGIMGNYQLIHSNLKSGRRMEIYNPDWRERIIIAR